MAATAILLAAGSANADLASVKALYLRGEFPAALSELKPLAEAGDAKAQSLLGYMLDFGEGVTEDDPAAARWYCRAAEQGDASAQFNLGMMYGAGKGVRQDDLQAWVWLSLSAARAGRTGMNSDTRKALALAEAKMSPAEIGTARRRVANWRATLEPQAKGRHVPASPASLCGVL